MPSSGLGGFAVAAPPTHTLVVTGHGRESETIAATREGGYGKKRMSRETGLSYNTIIKYLERMDAEASGAFGVPEAATSPASGAPDQR